MYRATPSNVIGIPIFRKSATGLRKILLLLMVPAVILLVHYRTQDLERVKVRTSWLTEPAELQHDDTDDTSFELVTLATLNGGDPIEDSPSDQSEEQTSFQAKEQTISQPEEQTSFQYDELTTDPSQSWFVPHETAEDVSIVAARSGSEPTDWIDEFCADYKCTPYIYSLDEQPDDQFLIPYTRKGHEASAYLSYIIGNYDNLAPYTIFIHGRSEQWHNDVAGPNTQNVLLNLRYEAVSRNGYVNLRCTNRPGCPSTIFQAFPTPIDDDYQYVIDQLPEVLGYLLNIDPSEVPSDIGHQCCAQFAVTRERIQERPRDDYIRILGWIATTDLTDNYGIGWLVEKLWHVIFGMPAVYCASEEQCRCDLYGWCGPNPSTNNMILTPVS